MPTRNIHLTSTPHADAAGKLPTGCGKRVAKRYASRFLEDAGCPACLEHPETVAAAERLQLELRRACYVSDLNCAGKAAAHEAAGDDLSDVDAGAFCGLIHLGACSREGADFDRAKFVALDTRATPDRMKFCGLCGVTVLHAGGRCLSANHARNAERAGITFNRKGDLTLED
jgi:hypothetical protein